jgi:hypothetical protein
LCSPCIGSLNSASSSGTLLSRFLSSAVSAGSGPQRDVTQLMKLPRQPVLVPAMVGSVRCYAKRPKKWQGGRFGLSRSGALGFGFAMINPKP